MTSDDIEATARRTGCVPRTSKITGKLLLALVTFGPWSAGKTTLAHLAAQGAHVRQPVEVSPEAIRQRMHKNAMAFLQDMLRQVLAKLQALTPVGEDGRFAAFHKVYIADSTGFELPDDLHKTFPGAGGSATQAGATIQAVWDDKSSLLDHFALTPWHIPAQQYVDAVVTLAPQGILLRVDAGDFTVKAWASRATAGAYFCCRLHHQTNMYETVTGCADPLPLEADLRTVAPDRRLLEQAIFIGATARVAARLSAVRMPAAVVKARRRIARTNAQKKATPPPKPILPGWHGTS